MLWKDVDIFLLALANEGWGIPAICQLDEGIEVELTSDCWTLSAWFSEDPTIIHVTSDMTTVTFTSDEYQRLFQWLRNYETYLGHTFSRADDRGHSSGLNQ